MGNRIIKDSITDSKKVGALTDFQFRLWIYLITYADDYGRAPADPQLIKGHLYTRRACVTEAQIERGLADLATADMIRIYQGVDGESYCLFPNWSDHQRIQTKRSKYPEPPAELQQSTEIHRESRWITVSHGDSPPESEYESEYESNPKESPRADARATSPTLEDVQAYVKEQRLRMDPGKFYDYYARNGWKVNGEPMHDWRAAVRYWARNEHGRGNASKPQPERPASYDLPKAQERADTTVPKFKKRDR